MKSPCCRGEEESWPFRLGPGVATCLAPFIICARPVRFLAGLGRENEKIERTGSAGRCFRYACSLLTPRKTSAGRPVSRVLCRTRGTATVIYLAIQLPGQ